MQNTERSRLMRMSWQIQKRRKSNRSKSLFAAWAIFLNEDITVLHLVQKHGNGHGTKKVNTANLSLFKH